MKTYSFILGNEEEIVAGGTYYLGQLHDGSVDLQEVLKDKTICVGNNEDDMPVIAAFDVTEQNEDINKTIVKITELY